MTGSVALWDFDGTLTFRDGRWRGSLVEASTEVAPGHGIARADPAPGLQDGFPRHRPETGHPAPQHPGRPVGRPPSALREGLRRRGRRRRTAARAARGVLAHYTDATRRTVFPDTAAALTEPTAVGRRHVVVSNHVPELDGLLRDLVLAGHFATWSTPR
ncbi:hypothetical protein AB0I51_03155 [Streptomyces sp. NPDC050549]|uniref:hypothetical protein n=1 Tax=Streptomyces sp. NPDC050549 TaxID=3155406 RepID=UPI00342CC909